MRRTASAALMLLLCSALARGDHRDDFANGVIALERGDLPEAVRLLSAAVKENPKESTDRVKLYGMRYKEYVPHFFLGIAYSKSGDCFSAIEELTESERQGVAQGLTKNASEWGTIKDNLANCITMLAKSGRPIRRPTESIAGAVNATPRPPAPTPELVAQAAPRPTVAAPTIAASPTSVPPARPTTAPPPPPDSLLSAAARYFRGDYAGAVKALASARYPDARATAQALLFRSAAGYSLFVLGGSREKTLEERAGRDARESARLDPGLRVSAKDFSPRFAAFFERSRG